MKVKITFEWNPYVMANYPCWAHYRDTQACGETWEDAEQRLLKKLRIIAAAHSVPEDKEVEL